MLTIDGIHCELDFDAQGKQFGSIDLRFSNNEFAFSKIPVPVVVIKNGPGPTLLLTAGNHGDEYEGQVILRRLIHEIELEDFTGRLIILPALNYPAVLDNSRISPLDQGNMNRSFPGIEGGSPTSAIAHFVSSRILPLADAGIDLHSGGTTAYYLPSTFLCTTNNTELMHQNLAMAEAFNAPFTYIVRGENSASGFDPTAHVRGIPFISCELYGGGNVDVNATQIGSAGVKNVMQQMGMISEQSECDMQTRFLNGIDGSYTLSASFAGLFEPYHEMGDEVKAGDIAGQLYSVEEVERKPLELEFEKAGIIMARRNGARVIRGSHLFMVSAAMSRDEVLNLM